MCIEKFVMSLGRCSMDQSGKISEPQILPVIPMESAHSLNDNHNVFYVLYCTCFTYW